MSCDFIAAADDEGRRLDRILRKALRGLPLSAIHRLLRQRRILVDGKPAAPSARVQTGQTITIPDGISDDTRYENSAPPSQRKTGGLQILFEGSGLLVLNKPSGIAVHREDKSPHGAPHLAASVLAYLAPKLPPSLSFKPGPLHRLDKPSSGIIVFSTNLAGAKQFSALMQERKIKKIYLALVEGKLDRAETWQDELARDQTRRKTFTAAGDNTQTKTALSRVKPLAKSAACTLILVEIQTGRPHQIRAQAAARGHPLLGDKKYGAKFCPENGFLLHAWRMEFPADVSFPPSIQAPLPERFAGKIREIFGEDVLLELAPEMNRT